MLYGLYAAAAPDAGGLLGGNMGMIIMIVAMVAIMYFLMIRPQKKKEKQTREMISALAKGDSITTIGGIKGKIVRIKDDEILIETGMIGNVNEQSTLRMTKWAIRDVTKKADTKELETADSSDDSE